MSHFEERLFLSVADWVTPGLERGFDVLGFIGVDGFSVIHRRNDKAGGESALCAPESCRFPGGCFSFFATGLSQLKAIGTQGDHRTEGVPASALSLSPFRFTKANIARQAVEFGVFRSGANRIRSMKQSSNLSSWSWR